MDGSRPVEGICKRENTGETKVDSLMRQWACTHDDNAKGETWTMEMEMVTKDLMISGACSAGSAAK